MIDSKITQLLIFIEALKER